VRLHQAALPFLLARLAVALAHEVRSGERFGPFAEFEVDAQGLRFGPAPDARLFDGAQRLVLART
jgi:hypothetical protein